MSINHLKDEDGDEMETVEKKYTGKRKALTTKEKGKQKNSNDEGTGQIIERRVTFTSPQNKTYYYNQDYALAWPLKIRSPIVENRSPTVAKVHTKGKQGKMIYRVKSLSREPINTTTQTDGQ